MGRSYTYAVTADGNGVRGGWWVIAPPAEGSFDGIAHYSAELAKAINAIEPAKLISPASWRALHESHAALARTDAVKGILLQYSPPSFVKTDLPKLLSILALVRKRGLPVVTTVHEYWPPPSSSPKRMVWRWLCRKALAAVITRSSAVATTTPYAAGQLEEAGFGSAKFTAVIPVGTGIQVGRRPAEARAASEGGQAQTFVIFGQPVAFDREVVLHFARWAAAQTPRPRVIWVARGAAEIQSWWRSIGAPDVVEIRAGLPAADVSQLLSEATIGLAPYVDGASTRRSSLAALIAHGLPIVALDGRYTDDRLRKSGGLLMSPLENGPAFVANVERMIGDQQVRSASATSVAKLYETELSWPRIAQQYLEVLKK